MDMCGFDPELEAPIIDDLVDREESENHEETAVDVETASQMALKCPNASRSA
jgi:hypothetical protein